MSWQSHSLVSAVIGRPEKCTGTQIAPRRPTIQVETGESKPLESSVHDLAGRADGKPAHAGRGGRVDEGVALDHVHDDGHVRGVDVDLLVGGRPRTGPAPTIWFISRLWRS